MNTDTCVLTKRIEGVRVPTIKDKLGPMMVQDEKKEETVLFNEVIYQTHVISKQMRDKIRPRIESVER